MAVQVSYPGVYIEEFAPGAPIEGVGTSTAGFIGTASRGPIREPRLIQSWDQFEREFGGFIAEPPISGHLAHGVYGFFLNGGTACYVVRESTGVMASRPLPSRAGGGTPPTVLTVRAREEGPAGNAIEVIVRDRSLLAHLLATSAAERTITGITGSTLDLDPAGTNQGYAVGQAVELANTAGTTSRLAVVESLPGDDQIELAALPTGVSFANGTVGPAPVIAVRRVETTASAVSPDGLTLTVASNQGFAPGDRIRIEEQGGGTAQEREVRQLIANDRLVLSAAVPTTIAPADLRTADLATGRREIRLALPTGASLSGALPPGSSISLASLANGQPTATPEYYTVESSGGDVLTLTEGLLSTRSLSSAADVPVVASLEFEVEVRSPGRPAEEFELVAMHPRHPNYWRTTLTSESVTFEEPAPTAPPSPPIDPRPVANTYQLTGGQPDNRQSAWASITGTPSSYLDLLRREDEVAIVVIPGATDSAVQQAMITHCEQMHDRFAILDSVRGADLQGIRSQVATVRSGAGYAALYYPWILARNPLTRKDELWPPSGHLAGVYARTDAQRGVHKAPANTNIRGALAVERRLTDAEQGPINLMGINVIRVFPEQAQPMVWGARTTATDRNWQYVNVRRLFLFMEESIEEGIRWAVFEPNNLELWQKLKRTITDFLTRVWRDGALFGATPQEAFYVRIDEALNPVSTQALGRLYIEIGVRPTYPAEFIVVRIGIWQGGSDVSE